MCRIDGLGFKGGRDDWFWFDKKPGCRVVGLKLPWQIGGLCIKKEWGQQRPVGRNWQDSLALLDNAGWNTGCRLRGQESQCWKHCVEGRFWKAYFQDHALASFFIFSIGWYWSLFLCRKADVKYIFWRKGQIRIQATVSNLVNDFVNNKMEG